MCRKHNYTIIVPYTTRPMRPGEVDGREYHFISEESFMRKVEAEEFIEYQAYNTNQGVWYYGTPKDEFIEATDKTIVILSARSLKVLSDAGVFDDSDLIFYIESPEEIIRQCINMRGGDLVEAERRFNSDNADFDGIEKYVSYVIKRTETTSPYKMCECIVDIIKLHDRWNGLVRVGM